MTKIINVSSITSTYELPDQSVKNYTNTSNESATENMTVSFTKVRTSEKEYAAPTEEVEQTLVLTNNSEIQIDNIRIVDTISEDAEFVEGSMTIDDAPQTDFVPSNYTLPDSLMPNSSTTIKYNIKIKDNPTSTTANVISSITYDVAEVTDLNEMSNEAEVSIIKNLITIEKTSDKSAVISGQKLMFQSVITNKGEYTNTQVTFKDPIPEGTKFVDGSVKVDEVEQPGSNPEVGFSIGDMEPNKVITVTFDVTVE